MVCSSLNSKQNMPRWGVNASLSKERSQNVPEMCWRYLNSHRCVCLHRKALSRDNFIKTANKQSNFNGWHGGVTAAGHHQGAITMSWLIHVFGWGESVCCECVFWPVRPSLTSSLTGSCSSSHRLPPLTKHVVDEFGHGLGAAVAPFVGAVLQLLHHLSDELGEEDGDVLVAFGRRHFLEVAAVLLSQAAAFVFADLPGVAQVLFVPHQAHGNIRLPGREAASGSFQVFFKKF